MKDYFSLLYKDSKESYYKELESWLNKDIKKFIITANPETFMMARSNKEVESMLYDKDVSLVADGIGIIKAAKILNINIKERIPGVDIANNLFILANKYHKSMYLFGSSKSVLESMQVVIKDKYPNIKLLGVTDGYVENKENEYEKLIKLKPDIAMVALGIPKQEELIYKYFSEFKKGIFVGVGGSLDVLSGTKKRAPKFFIKCNLEWLYRIVKEPKRIKRFYQNNIKFMFKIMKEK